MRGSIFDSRYMSENQDWFEIFFDNFRWVNLFDPLISSELFDKRSNMESSDSDFLNFIQEPTD